MKNLFNILISFVFISLVVMLVVTVGTFVIGFGVKIGLGILNLVI